MRKAARAIIIKDDKILVMKRTKNGNKYHTLVGGRLNDDETLEQALVREVDEETGLRVTAASLVFFEEHPEPYNQQYIYLCEVAPFTDAAIRQSSEEGMMNRIDIDLHTLEWVDFGAFSKLQFRTPQLQKAIADGLAQGFPQQPIKI